MTSSKYATTVITAMAFLCVATPPGASEPRIKVEELNPWTHLDLANEPDAFQFAIVTDRTGGHRPGVFPDAVRKLNLLRPEFIMSVGDLIEGYTEDRDVLKVQWDEFSSFVEQLEMPFFYLPGNHDISNTVMADVWEQRFGRSRYSFVYRDVLFVCLNSEDTAPSRIAGEQLEWLGDVLAGHADVRWTLVFVHKPLWEHVDAQSGELQDTGWPEVEVLLRGRQHTVFAGHNHAYVKYERNDSRYFVLATTGGGSSLMGPLYGQFDHVVWVTMTNSGPRIANLMLDGIWDEDIRTEEVARMVDHLTRGNALVVQPIMADSERFREGRSEIRLTNHADTPLRMTARFDDSDMFAVSPESLDVRLAPNSVEQIPVTFQSDEWRSIDSVAPLTLHWQAEYVETEIEIPVMDGSSPLVVSRIYTLPRRQLPVVVDGDLSDWEDLSFDIRKPAEIDVAEDSWLGPDDCSWRFAVEMDSEKLYVAVDVTDERRIYLDANAWSQDGIEVRLDGRPDPYRSLNRDDGGHLVFIAISPAQRLEDMTMVDSDLLESLGVEAVGVPSPRGHIYEMAIPLSYIEKRQGKDWKRVRINIAVDDFDDPEGPLAQLWWQPDWRDPTNYPGSGTFERE